MRWITTVVVATAIAGLALAGWAADAEAGTWVRPGATAPAPAPAPKKHGKKPKGGTTTPADPNTGTDPGTGSGGTTGSVQGITQVDGRTWDVSSALVDKYTNNPNALGAQAGVTQVDDGWKVTNVKNGSEVQALGVKAGDVITAVNGCSLGKPLNTLLCSQKLKGEDSYVVKLTRAGKSRTQTYRVQ